MARACERGREMCREHSHTVHLTWSNQALPRGAQAGAVATALSRVQRTREFYLLVGTRRCTGTIGSKRAKIVVVKHQNIVELVYERRRSQRR